jgi:leucyl-tRNA synthetase
MAEELWMRLGRRFSVVDRPWPAADAAAAREDDVELAVQVNGKVREHIRVPLGTVEEEIRARALEAVKHHVDGKRVVKVVVVPGRLVNVVIQ